MVRVDVKPGLIRWARERSRIDADVLERRFPNLPRWERGEQKPTLKQLDAFARATHAAIGFFFLDAPPVETLPIPDFRSGRGRRNATPSPNLLDTVYICQQRQEWYRDFARAAREEPRAFVGSLTTRTPAVRAAEAIRATLGFDLEARRNAPTWEDALRDFIQKADAVGVLVMRNAIVHNNTHRPLDPEEFRGFALSDPYAPLVFLNGADSKSAQMFTLAHELGHIWLGRSALDDADMVSPSDDATERWCNEVAAEILVPIAVLRDEFRAGADLTVELRRLSRRFKVSTLVVLRRIFDAGAISRTVFREAYSEELERIPERVPSEGGDFYRTETSRVGNRFASALITSTLEGHTLYLDAFRMLGIRKAETFNELGRHLSVAL